MTARAWSGRAVMVARGIVARWIVDAGGALPCGQCGQPVTLGDAWVVGHIKSRAQHPELMFDPGNWRAEHRSCSNKSAQSVVVEKARAEGAAATLDALGLVDVELPGMPIFPAPIPPAEPPPLPVSLPGDQPAPFEVPELMTWTSFVQAAPDWLQSHLVMDANSNPPLAISPLHPDALGSFALPDPGRAACPEGAIAWIEKAEAKTLRWWQRLGLILKLQCDANGRLLKDNVTETGPRRAGKSVGLRGLALWRMEFGGALFGERQEIIHTGSDIAVCRKAQKAAWRWATGRWGKKAVTAANGKEQIERPDDGSVWMVRSQNAVYGWDTTLAMVDEGWDVAPDVVSEGLDPSLLGRSSPQRVMTSTSHRRATSTMRTALADALTGQDPSSLLLWWGAKPDDDVSDPATWKAASPYWDEDRAAYVAKQYAKALAGEADPEFDDPDPMRGFACQYANLWNLKQRRERGEPLIESGDWRALIALAPASRPVAVAVESWFGLGVSVAAAHLVEDGRVVVAVHPHPDAAAAAAAITASGYRHKVVVGASLASDPAFKRLRTEPRRGGTSAAAHDLQRLLGAGLIWHDGGAHLTTQVEALRVLPSTDGDRVVSTTRADALKAAVWAVDAARARPVRRPGGVRIITAQSA